MKREMLLFWHIQIKIKYIEFLTAEEQETFNVMYAEVHKVTQNYGEINRKKNGNREFKMSERANRTT